MTQDETPKLVGGVKVVLPTQFDTTARDDSPEDGDTFYDRTWGLRTYVGGIWRTAAALPFADDASRDAAVPAPAPGQMIWNQQRACVQQYNTDFGCWVGYSDNNAPVFVDLLDQFHHVIPTSTMGADFGGEVCSAILGCKSNGKTLSDALRDTAVQSEQGCSQGVFYHKTDAKLYKSADGVAALSEVISANVSSLGESLIDLGGGELLFIAYGLRIWYSADGGDHWGSNSPAFDDGAPLITANASAITHFHGGAYDSTHGRLYAFTGDTSAGSSILFCDDVADLVANPATWAARWGLDDATRSHLDESYVIGHGTQYFRVISMCFVGDWAYCASDGTRGNPDTGTRAGYPAFRIHRTSGQIEDIYCHAPDDPPADYDTPGLLAGVGWKVGVATDGVTVLIGTASEWSGAAYRTGCDEFVRLYAVLPDGRQAIEIARVRRADYAAPTGIAEPMRMFNLNGVLLVTGDNNVPALCGRVVRRGRIVEAMARSTSSRVSIDPPESLGVATQQPILNYVPNGRFLNDATGWTAYGSATVARDTATKDRALPASLSVTPGAAASHARYTLDADRLETLRGKLVTLSARVWLPAVRNNAQDPSLHLRIGATDYVQASLASDALFNGGWHDVSVTAYLPSTEASVSVRLYSNYQTYDAAMLPVYFSDVRLAVGNLSAPEGTPPVLAVV